MMCNTICGYCRKGVKLAHVIEADYMYFNGSGIWGGETMSYCIPPYLDQCDVLYSTAHTFTYVVMLIYFRDVLYFLLCLRN